MRTTLDIETRLLRQAKRRAVESGTTLTHLLEDALRNKLAGRVASRRTHRFRFPTVRGRTLPGVDISDRNSLYDRMEKRS